jgi:hypothetical protein
MRDLESRLRALDLRPPDDLPRRALAAAAAPAQVPRHLRRNHRPRRRLLLALAAAALVALLAGYAAVAVTAASRAQATGPAGYGPSEGCWFVRDGAGLHLHVGGFYRGLPALCTSERRVP